MAAKVNVKFVAILAAVLLLLTAGAGFLAYQVISKSGEDHERMGDEFAASGQLEEAAEEYSKAVAEDPTNVRWLTKWRNTLVQIIPDTQQEYSEAYGEHFIGILRQLANAQPTDPAPQREFLDAVYRQSVLSSSTGQQWSDVRDMAVRMTRQLDQSRPEAQAARRYAGLAGVAQMRTMDVTADRKREIEEDLRAAIEGDPNDMQSHLALLEMQTIEAQRVKRNGRLDEAERRIAEAKAQADALIARFPNDPRPQLRRWQIEVMLPIELVQTFPQQEQFRDTYGPMLDPVIEKVDKSEEALADRAFLQGLQGALLTSRPEDGPDIWLGVLDRATRVSPDDTGLKMLRAEALSYRQLDEQAIEQYQEILDAPDLTVSLEGLMLRGYRTAAAAAMVERAVRIWEIAPEDQKEAAGERAKRLRDQLAQRVPADSQLLVRADALIAYTDRDWGTAVNHLADLNRRAQSNDVGVLRLLAQALHNQGNLGVAVEQYDRIVQLDPRNVEAQLRASQIEIRLQNFRGALARLRTVEVIDPENEEIRNQIEVIRRAIEQEGTITDPVLAGLVEARHMRSDAGGNDVAGAKAKLDQMLLDYPNDSRVAEERILVALADNDLDDAKRRNAAALEKFPGDPRFRSIAIQLEEGDPVLRQILLIDEAGGSEFERALRKYYVYRSAGDEWRDKAKEMLDFAKAARPDDPSLVEIQFVEAIEAKDYAKAREYAMEAARNNLDEVNGLLYQGRLEMAEGKSDAALATLTKATEQMPFSAAAWRLLGQVRLGRGQVDPALEAFRRAVEIRPNDPSLVKPYLIALLDLRRDSEALDAARRARSINPNDASIQSVWLDLEERVGSKKTALEARRLRARIDPSDRENNIAMARLMLAMGDLAGAETMMEPLPDSGLPGLSPSILRARLHFLRGDPDAAKAVWEKLIPTLERQEEQLQARLAQAEFLFEYGSQAEAIEILESVRDMQSKEFMEVDRRLGDAYFNANRHEDAVAAYQRVLDAGADRDNVVRKRQIEGFLRMEDWSRVDQAIAALEKEQGRDLQTVMLAADAASGRGDNRRARQLVDEAVALAPRDPLPYYRRAQLLMDEDAQAPAVIRDLDQALRLRPNLIPARQLMAQVLFRQGRVDEAFSQIRTAVELNPTNDELRLRFLQELVRVGKMDDARVEAAKAVEARAEEEPTWYLRAGEVYSRAGDHLRAAELYKRSYDLFRSPETIGRIVDVLLQMSPPHTRDARAGMDRMTPEEKEKNRLLVEVLSARITYAEGNRDEAMRMFAKTWPMARDFPIICRTWVGQLDLMLGGNSPRIAAFLESLEPPSGMPAHARVLLARHIMVDPNRWDEALTLLEGAEEESNDGFTLADLHRLRGQLYYFREDYSKAVEEYRAALELLPANSEFNNNLAFILASHLNDPQSALEYAEEAAFLEPNNPSVLDTLGVIYHRLGQLTKAEQTLQRSLENAVERPDKVAATYHMAKLKADQKKFADAATLAGQAKDLIAGDSVLQQTYAADIDSLLGDLQSR